MASSCEISHYNWLRVPVGETLLDKEYVEFLFESLFRLCEIDGRKFGKGIIIQTNGIYVGKGNKEQIDQYIRKIHRIDPSIKIAIETSIEGTNPGEFALLTQTPSEDSFKYNLNSYSN